MSVAYGSDSHYVPPPQSTLVMMGGGTPTLTAQVQNQYVQQNQPQFQYPYVQQIAQPVQYVQSQSSSMGKTADATTQLQNPDLGSRAGWFLNPSRSISPSPSPCRVLNLVSPVSYAAPTCTLPLFRIEPPGSRECECSGCSETARPGLALYEHRSHCQREYWRDCGVHRVRHCPHSARHSYRAVQEATVEGMVFSCPNGGVGQLAGHRDSAHPRLVWNGELVKENVMHCNRYDDADTVACSHGLDSASFT